MKSLILVRHAKTHPADYGMSDHSRTLMERGIADAETMGKRLAAKQVQPDLIVCSSAVRAESTAKILAKELGYAQDQILVKPEIYEAWLDEVLDVIHTLPDERNTVLLVGHNPAFTGMVELLSGIVLDHLPSAGIAHFQFSIQSWKNVKEHSATLLDVDYPKK